MDLTAVRGAFKGLWRSVWSDETDKEIVMQCEDFLAIGDRVYAILRDPDGAKRCDLLDSADVWYPDQSAAQKVADLTNGDDDEAEQAAA